MTGGWGNRRKLQETSERGGNYRRQGEKEEMTGGRGKTRKFRDTGDRGSRIWQKTGDNLGKTRVRIYGRMKLGAREEKTRDI